MNINENYLQKNKLAWNQRTKIHVNSNFYDQQTFLDGRNSLNEIELSLLGDVSGKKILHLQCHFGQDSISLSRMGAKVCGIDLSDEAINIAQTTSENLDIDTQFICCDLYDLPKHLQGQFDIVFTSYGTIGWLPDIKKWASIVSQYLKPNGEFVFVEFHPVLWMFDNDLKEVKYNYFNEDAIIEIEDGSYADRKAPITIETVTWNHGLSEVIQSLLNEKLELLSFQEYDYSPYNVIPNGVEIAASKFRSLHHGNKIPLVYSLKMKKK